MTCCPQLTTVPAGRLPTCARATCGEPSAKAIIAAAEPANLVRFSFLVAISERAQVRGPVSPWLPACWLLPYPTSRPTILSGGGFILKRSIPSDCCSACPTGLARFTGPAASLGQWFTASSLRPVTQAAHRVSISGSAGASLDYALRYENTSPGPSYDRVGVWRLSLFGYCGLTQFPW